MLEALSGHLPIPPFWMTGWALALLTPIALLFPILSALLERSGPIRLRHWAEGAGGRLRQLYDRPRHFESFRLLLNLVARLAPVGLVGVLWLWLTMVGVTGSWWIAPLAVTVALSLVEWLNRFLVGLHSERALALLTGPFRLVSWLLTPLVWLGACLVPEERPEEEDDDEASDEEIDAYIDVGLREGILEPEEQELVRSIVDFGDTQVRSVMTPRVEIHSAPSDAALEVLAKIFFDCKSSRLPIYRQSIDHIVGILHIRDLFEALHQGQDVTPADLAKEPHYVPETKTLRELLTELQEMRQQMAIVVDEYGGVAGLVTVEDLLEEIVGEISDEHELTSTQRVRIGDGRWRVKGRTELEKLDEIFDLDLDDLLPYETVSGLVCGELGYVPKVGEVVVSHGLTFTVEEADGRRVTVVAVERAPEPSESQE